MSYINNIGSDDPQPDDPRDDWNYGEPPQIASRRYLLRFASGIICSGQWRAGRLGEPQPREIGWRCDCCGKWATPIAWIDLPPT